MIRPSPVGRRPGRPYISRMSLAQRLGSYRWFARLGRALVPADRLVARATKGRVVALGLAPSLIITTTGRKTGQPRTQPLVYAPDGDGFAVIGSNWGQTTHPAWSANLLAHPHAVVRLKGRTITVDAARWPELHRSALVPSAADVAGGRLHVLFEGSPRAVDAQALALGGEESEPWQEVRALQARLPGRRRWDGGDAPLVRPGPRVAYTAEAREERWNPLAERVVEALCSPS